MSPFLPRRRLAAGVRFAAAAAALLACAATADAPAFRLGGPLVQGALVRGTAPAGTIALTLDGKRVPLAPDGRFLLGLDRDQAGTALLAAELEGGGTVRQPLTIAPRIWPTEHVDIARGTGSPSEEYLRLRERELARIEAARALQPQTLGWSQTFIWPARGRISGVFGSQRIYRGGEAGAYHSGVDVAAGAGAIVAAPADGVVVLAGPPAFSLEGNLVIIAHGMGLSSAFLHLATALVREGEAVRQGQAIGTVGSTGRATGPHLHWSLKWNQARIDPQMVAGPMR
jgi:murein DD-endopeptidase MepM/ murein hydrolase activator NlpD